MSQFHTLWDIKRHREAKPPARGQTLSTTAAPTAWRRPHLSPSALEGNDPPPHPASGGTASDVSTGTVSGRTETRQQRARFTHRGNLQDVSSAGWPRESIPVSSGTGLWTRPGADTSHQTPQIQPPECGVQIQQQNRFSSEDSLGKKYIWSALRTHRARHDRSFTNVTR